MKRLIRKFIQWLGKIIIAGDKDLFDMTFDTKLEDEDKHKSTLK